VNIPRQEIDDFPSFLRDFIVPQCPELQRLSDFSSIRLGNQIDKGRAVFVPEKHLVESKTTSQLFTSNYFPTRGGRHVVYLFTEERIGGSEDEPLNISDDDDFGNLASFDEEVWQHDEIQDPQPDDFDDQSSLESLTNIIGPSLKHRGLKNDAETQDPNDSDVIVVDGSPQHTRAKNARTVRFQLDTDSQLRRQDDIDEQDQDDLPPKSKKQQRKRSASRASLSPISQRSTRQTKAHEVIQEQPLRASSSSLPKANQGRRKIKEKDEVVNDDSTKPLTRLRKRQDPNITLEPGYQGPG
jgi:hypothetical protein